MTETVRAGAWHMKLLFYTISIHQAEQQVGHEELELRQGEGSSLGSQQPRGEASTKSNMQQPSDSGGQGRFGFREGEAEAMPGHEQTREQVPEQAPHKFRGPISHSMPLQTRGQHVCVRPGEPVFPHQAVAGGEAVFQIFCSRRRRIRDTITSSLSWFMGSQLPDLW